MEILNMNRARRARYLLAIALVVVLAGCAFVDSLFGPEDVSGFNHLVHIDEVGLSCEDCHDAVYDDDAPGMPELDFCLSCHEDMDEDKPVEKMARFYFDEEGESRSKQVTALPEEVVFSHLGHVEAELECSACHEGIETSVAVTSKLAIGMQDCMDCHDSSDLAGRARNAEEGVEPFASRPGISPDACVFCHSEIDENWSPPSHERDWQHVHGTVVRSGDMAPANQCSLCHNEWSCASCHQEIPPEDHNNYFRNIGHAVHASIDRNRCAVCHRDDFCTRCHQEVLPRSHVGGFGSPANRHCYGCHFPLSTSTCVTCHKSAPSHDMATPQPSWHTPGMNCRQCHGLDIPLRHLDNGTECTFCHQ
jgi:hypothetical protein